MTHSQKVKAVMSKMGLTKKEATEQVYFLNWTVKEDDFLKQIYPNYLKDIDPKASFIEMCLRLWNDKSTGIRLENIK